MENEPKVFDESYVRQLRDEAAGYRTKAKEQASELESYKRLEGEIHQLRVENEITRRGLNIEPQFINYNGTGSVSEAVDNFLEKYPQFAPEASKGKTPQHKDIPEALPPSKGKANVSNSRLDKSWDELKADPVTREEVGRLYRNLLPFSNSPKD